MPMDKQDEIKNYLFDLLNEDEKEILEAVSETSDLEEAMKLLIGFKED